MNELVFMGKDNSPTTTSLIVAEKFGKAHKDVLRAIDALITAEPSLAGRNFALSEFRDASGRALRMYIMDRTGFALLAMGFTGPEALKWKIEFLRVFDALCSIITPEQVKELKQQLAQKDHRIAQEKRTNESLLEHLKNETKRADERWHSPEEYADRIKHRRLTPEQLNRFDYLALRECGGVDGRRRVDRIKGECIASYPRSVLDAAWRELENEGTI